MIKSKRTSQPVAPEDLRCGEYVSITQVVMEHLPCELERPSWENQGPVKTLWLPFCAPRPMKVVDISLPFVFVQMATGKHEVVDVRRFRLARLPEPFGKKAFKRLKDQS